MATKIDPPLEVDFAKATKTLRFYTFEEIEAWAERQREVWSVLRENIPGSVRSGKQAVNTQWSTASTLHATVQNILKIGSELEPDLGPNREKDRSNIQAISKRHLLTFGITRSETRSDNLKSR